MKKALILPGIIGLLAALVSFTAADDPILGRWTHMQKTPDGPINLMFVFRADSTYDGIVNGKPFIHGKYFVRHDTMRIADNSCNLDYYGTYRLKYLAKDSLMFTAISDTCKQRYEGANGLVCKKMPKK